MQQERIALRKLEEEERKKRKSQEKAQAISGAIFPQGLAQPIGQGQFPGRLPDGGVLERTGGGQVSDTRQRVAKLIELGLTPQQAIKSIESGRQQAPIADTSGSEVIKNLSPEARTEFRKAKGKNIAEKLSSFQSQVNKLPGLKQTVEDLRELSNKASFALTERSADFFRRSFGQPVSAGAVARSQYIAAIDNQVLPLLRDTFGAQFTEREGETLKATLGDVNKTPAERNAILDAFISQKEANLRSLGRELQIDIPDFAQQPAAPVAQPAAQQSSAIDAELKRRGL
jgi:hypothetical protein